MCIRDREEPVKAQILSVLKEKYDMEEEDFLSAEFEVVPAGPARDYGLDRSMVMAYGHDDRVCSYPSFMAMLAQDKVKYTSVCLLVDKEDVYKRQLPICEHSAQSLLSAIRGKSAASDRQRHGDCPS